MSPYRYKKEYLKTKTLAELESLRKSAQRMIDYTERRRDNAITEYSEAIWIAAKATHELNLDDINSTLKLLTPNS